MLWAPPYLKQPGLSEREPRVFANDDVIKDAHVDQCKCRFESLRYAAVVVARLGASGRIVVGIMCPRLFCVSDGLTH